ncbi:MAG: transcriptional repressor [Eubacterium sp.]|nr:transcriptional repressor [Eubacterium sp.]
MAEKKYKTKQREELESYLKTIPEKHFTVQDICAHFREEGRNIGTTTVYRQLERLMEEGRVNKYILDESSSACFEYINTESKCHHPSCYHMKCEKCGKLYHLDCHEIEDLTSHLKEHHGFTVDPFRTVFYGICAECSGETDHCGEGCACHEHGTAHEHGAQ